MTEIRRIPVPRDEPDAMRMALASAALPGLGQFLVGQKGKGALFMALTLASCGLGYLLAPTLAWDAHFQARRQLAGEELDPWGFF